MRCCGLSCYETRKHIIYIIGEKAHKEEFVRKVLDVVPNNDAFEEFNVNYKHTPLVIQSCYVDTTLEEIDNTHSKLACGIVYLSKTDKPVSYNNHTLFVLMGSKSRQVSEDRLIVASVQNESYAECKEGFDILISNLTKH
ncbi:hypothetical protein PAEPH01_0029 [Pancytospora epiphaga]|nr:hypothetical protein PAEPH01_0029 [Pancytospora epiphaga]